jgi:hypothetical protein
MIGDGINDALRWPPRTSGSRWARRLRRRDRVGRRGLHRSRSAASPRAFARPSGRHIINQNIILSLLIITALLPLALFGVLGLAAVVLVHEIAEVIVILNGLRAASTRKAST